MSRYLAMIPSTAAAILGLALLQWLVIVLISFFAKKIPKKLIASTAILAVAYGWAFHAESLMPKTKPKAAAADMVSAASIASCATITVGMQGQQVRNRMGQPHEIRDDAKTRGPGAATWVYRDSRCAVHMLDDKVELIE